MVGGWVAIFAIDALYCGGDGFLQLVDVAASGAWGVGDLARGNRE